MGQKRSQVQGLEICKEIIVTSCNGIAVQRTTYGENLNESLVESKIKIYDNYVATRITERSKQKGFILMFREPTINNYIEVHGNGMDLDGDELSK